LYFSGLFFSFSLQTWTLHVEVNSRINFLDFLKDSFEDYYKNCNPDKINASQDNKFFCESKYRYADVSWKGYVIRVDYEDHFFARYRLSLLIKMLDNHDEEPDLYLKLNDYQYSNFKDSIFNLTRGDRVYFNATILHEGDRKSIPILEVFGFEKLNEHISIDPHIHYSGRYSMGHEEIHKNATLYNDIPGLISDEDRDINQHETNH
jgi:hypothetical protein